MYLYLALGTNIGDARHNFRQMLLWLQYSQFTLLAISATYYSPPLGEIGEFVQKPYANKVVVCVPKKRFANVLRVLHRIEQKFMRPRQRQKGQNRKCDIDVLALGAWRQNGRIFVPHPALFSRSFVLLPLLEVGCFALAGTQLQQYVPYSCPQTIRKAGKIESMQLRRNCYF